MTPPPPSVLEGSTPTAARTANRAVEDAQPQTERDFIWGVGVECSFLPHIDVDQFQWTQHDRFWKDDLKLIREKLGVTKVRYALPWHQIETAPGVYDWKMADERVNFAHELGLELMMDVMHFGTPTWLPQAVGDVRFAESLERWTTALVSRYAQQIDVWCPFNEPSVSALFSGDFGFWPPFARKWRGYMPVLSRIATGVNRSIAAIRAAAPEATVLLCDAIENFQTRVPSLQNEVAMRNLRRFLVLDLLAGKVNRDHALHEWVTGFGMTELDLEFFQKNPQMPDWIGIDYYPHSDWQLELGHNNIAKQRRADSPLGFAHLARQVYNRYGVPVLMTETSADGPPISREIWLESMVEQAKELREEGVPMLGLVWWPVFDQIDWDGALRHRVGKLHRVGLFTLNRKEGILERKATPLVRTFKDLAEGKNKAVGELADLAIPLDDGDPQLQPLFNNPGEYTQSREKKSLSAKKLAELEGTPGLAGEPELADKVSAGNASESIKQTDKYGIVCFSHLRWGFVWQRPQQFLSRFAKYHPVLFVEEPFFDLPTGAEPRVDLHRVLPSVTVVTPHCPREMMSDPKLPSLLRKWTQEAMDAVNGTGAFDNPLLWYYSPLDSQWSLGHFRNRGVVYDCMDELSSFTGAPPSLLTAEKRLLENADVVFTGGLAIWESKKDHHPAAYCYGCGVEFNHFNAASDPDTTIPPDIDFINRPIIGWFGVVDERVDYHLLAEVAKLRPDWNLCIVGPVVKVDPNLLPHAPNLHWLGGRDYQQLPNYCAAFDVCMMCFAINQATKHINPTKGLEYMATGKPIVSTPVRDVVRQWSDIVALASTPQEFVQKVDELLTQPQTQRIEAGLALAKKNSWEGTVDAMRQNIRDAIGTPDNPKVDLRSKNVKPMDDAEVQRPYHHTPGS
ncbi:MAG: family 1 glycosylhydrolase [Tepidisphaeraceae bacterium]